MDSKTRRYITVFIYVAMGIALFAALSFVYPVYLQYRKTKEENLALKAEERDRMEEAERLNVQVSDLENGPEAVEKVAREKFNLLKDGEVIYSYDKDALEDKKKAK